MVRRNSIPAAVSLATDPPKSRQEALSQLGRAFGPREQRRARSYLEPDRALADVLQTYLRAPFLRLTDEELAAVSRIRPVEMGDLIRAREAAARSKAPRYAVFCMPKSGSSFVQSALQHALQLPFVSLTSFGTSGLSSYFGMNSREQELDEMALVRSILYAPKGFVAQHHTRYSPYLAFQMSAFGLKPIVTVRNIYDCIVSYDDMMLQWREGQGPKAWASDPQFALPIDYPELPLETRYTILAHSFGVWLINFYLSWKRAAGQGLVKPLVIRYEEDVLDDERLIERLSAVANMTAEQRDRLADYVRKPDPTLARLNVGRRGRGMERVPETLRAFLADYAGLFRELDAADLAYLTA
jgi:hypothetical protein